MVSLFFKKIKSITALNKNNKKNDKTMSTYRISGVWKNEAGAITHYAMHLVSEKTVSRAMKKTKAEAIQIVESYGNVTTTWIWNYNYAQWAIGESVYVVNGQYGKYIRSNPDNTLTDNLGHLIDYDWILS